MKIKSNTGPKTDYEKEWYASRVEHYECYQCKTKETFPRFNHPAKLLDTRCGRFGEWGNAFTCMCVALGYEARLCVDI